MLASVALLALLGAGVVPASASEPVPAGGVLPVPPARTGTVRGAARPVLPDRGDVVAAVRAAADFSLASLPATTLRPNGWNRSVHADGLLAAYAVTGDDRYRAALLGWAGAGRWELTTAEPDPDSLAAARTYVELQRLDPAVPLAAVDARLASDLAAQPDGAYDWSDALFMGLPVWARWAGRRGDDASWAKLDRLYRSSLGSVCGSRGLYDPAEHLWYRDCSYVEARDAYGGKVFWSRGNGWVLAGLAEVLATLPPDDPRAVAYRAMFRGMALRVAGLQGEDGLWRPSLLGSALYPQPETSGTALFTYAIAAGVRSGVLDRERYLPVLARAWHGLATVSLRPGGYLSNCQGVGGDPQPPFAGDGPAASLQLESPPFCVGVFLLAGGELAALARSVPKGAL